MSIKLSQEKANELFQKIGMEVVVVADESEADQNPDIETMSKAVFSEMEGKIKNDIEFEIKQTARTEEAGKFMGTLRNSLKREFGIDPKTTAEMDMVEVIKFAKETISKNKNAADSDLSKLLQEKEAEWDQKFTAQEEARMKELAEMQDKFEMRDIIEHAIGVVNIIPRVGGDPVKQAAMIISEAKSRYNLKYDPESKDILFYDKTNPEKKAIEGKNLVTAKSFAEQHLKDLGVFKTDNRDLDPSKVRQGDTGNNGHGIAAVDKGNSNDAMSFAAEALGITA